ncbi:DUF885 domain-containing protein [bacterium]|nr:DUF885 domain-containing protein [bacterium]
MNVDLARLAEDYWQYRLATFPTQSMMLGDHRFDDHMESMSRDAEDAHISSLRGFADRAEAFDAGALTADERITREVLVHVARAEAGEEEGRLAEIDVNPAVGFQAMLPVAFPQLPITEPEHAEAFESKLGDLGRLFDERTERLREGVAAGRTPVDLHARGVVAALDAQLALDPADDPLLRVRVPASFDEARTAEWKGRLARILEEKVRPAYLRHRNAIADEVLPASRSVDKPGLCHVPGGDAAYRAAMYRYVTLDKDPEDVHRIGLEQVERLEAEYLDLGSKVLGSTDLVEIFDRLRNDPELHFSEGPPIVVAAEAALAKGKAAMHEYFGRLPKADCLVSETPSGPIAFYFPPAADGSRPGTFFVNTSEPANWGTFQIQSMAFHEGIPGHHLQLAIAQELDDVPQFRRNAFISAYGEGWGLYVERLAEEMEMYDSDLDRIGMLWGDSMRACRLVVDTGMHALGWTRQQAIDYVVANSPMAVGQIEAEIDRYVGMAGQALSYMLGRIELQGLRAEAEKTMGDRFDLSGFHDLVLGSGVVPLDTLGRMVREWTAAG